MNGFVYTLLLNVKWETLPAAAVGGRLYSLDWTGLEWTGVDWTHPKICKKPFSV